MSSLFFILTFAAMTAVVSVLALGLISMARGGAFNEKYGNRLMQARVALQGLALAFFALAFLLR